MPCYRLRGTTHSYRCGDPRSGESRICTNAAFVRIGGASSEQAWLSSRVPGGQAGCMPRLQEVPEQLRHGLVSIAFAESVGFRRQRVYTRLGEILEEVRMQLGAADAA